MIEGRSSPFAQRVAKLGIQTNARLEGRGIESSHVSSAAPWLGLARTYFVLRFQR